MHKVYFCQNLKGYGILKMSCKHILNILGCLFWRYLLKSMEHFFGNFNRGIRDTGTSLPGPQYLVSTVGAAHTVIHVEIYNIDQDTERLLECSCVCSSLKCKDRSNKINKSFARM